MPIHKICEQCHKGYTLSRFCSMACRNANDRTAERRQLTCRTHGRNAADQRDSVGYLRCNNICYYHGRMSMNLSDYFKLPDAMSVGELAKSIGVKSEVQVRQWQHGYGGRIPSPENCVSIEVATGGLVTRRDLRPRDWHLIWPELVTKKHPAP